MEQGLKKETILDNGTYRIEEVLGQGSFGITYLAEHVRLKKKIAIKEFFMGEVNSRKDDGTTVEGSTGSVFTDYRRKFRKEAENLANLRHPNIVNVSDIFDENGTSYYVMDFIEGTNLDKYINEKGHLSEKEAIAITIEIGNALEYMHSKGMLHLDIKPSNIMRGLDGRHYLIDFGLSKQFSKDGRPEETTSIGLGTPGYAPIEQSTYIPDVTFPATLDVYALGATLYKMLTGVRPPDATYILNDGGLPTQKLKKNKVSNQTIETLKKAMKPAFRDRHQSVSELINDLISSNINDKKVDVSKEDLSDRTIIDNYTERGKQEKEDNKLNIQQSNLSIFSTNDSSSISNSNKTSTNNTKKDSSWKHISSLLLDSMGFLLKKSYQTIKFLFLGICGASVLYGSSFLIKKCSSSDSEVYAERIHQNPIIKNLLDNMIYVDGGTFVMATIDSVTDFYDVAPFHIGKYEVTQKEWVAVMDTNPAFYKGPDLPVSNISREDCQEFINKLNSFYGQKFRLPTEAEWEYAARGGNKSNYYKYSGSNDIEKVAWFYKNSYGKPHEVGTKKANELGLYDMSGNVWEWTSDGRTDVYVERGGDWDSSESTCTVDNYIQEAFYYTEGRSHHSGLRLAM